MLELSSPGAWHETRPVLELTTVAQCTSRRTRGPPMRRRKRLEAGIGSPGTHSCGIETPIIHIIAYVIPIFHIICNHVTCTAPRAPKSQRGARAKAAPFHPLGRGGGRGGVGEASAAPRLSSTQAASRPTASLDTGLSQLLCMPSMHITAVRQAPQRAPRAFGRERSSNEAGGRASVIDYL